TGPGSVGTNHVTRNFQEIAPRRAAPELSPSQRRDSILLHVRAPQVLDSLAKAKYDTAALRVVRGQIAQIENPPVAGRGGRGGGGGGGRGAGGQACEHP